MLFGNREPRSVVARRRAAFRPVCGHLEDRCLLAAAIDVGGNTPPVNPAIATVPYGVNLGGANTNEGDGFSVADVGDVNGDGYDDFVIGGPRVNSAFGLGTGTATVYLVFGSRSATAGSISSWLGNSPDGRVGDLAQLGSTAAQTNPASGNTGFPFSGIKITTSQEPNSNLGASVAAAGIINGTRAFLIGAPGANDSNGANAGTGRAYLIYGGSALTSLTNNTLDLDTVTSSSAVNVITFLNTATGSSTGASVAGVGDVVTDGINDIAIGAPTATVNGLSNAGYAYLVSGLTIPITTQTVNLATIGQTTTVNGVIFGGSQAGAMFGASVAQGGNVNGATTTSSQTIGDLLIGAPGTNSNAGAAYLVYGSATLPASGVVVGGVTQIPASQIGATNGVSGLTVNGGTSFQTGYSVATAGDFNGDGFADIMIGSPGAANNAGEVDLLYGAPVAGTPLVGTITLGSIPSSFNSLTFTGANTGDKAGYSLSQVGQVKTSVTNGTNPILIGAPGYNSLSGTVYLIPGNPSLTGTFSLGTINSLPVGATQFIITTPGVTSPAYFGASVSGIPTTSGQSATADSDLSADFIVGAPGYAVNATSRNYAGGVFIFEGGLIPLQTPTSNGITTTIGVDTPNGPFTNISATTPTALTIYVFSNNTITPPFDPVTDIDPTTITINGVAFPNATVTKDPVDENGDGIEDAIVTVSPRSAVGLTSTTTTLTIAGKTLASSAIPNKAFSGTANITVTGGGGGGGGGGGSGGGSVTSTLPQGTITPSEFLAPLGPDRYVPTLAALSAKPSYKAIPFRVAINQYLPGPGFAARLQLYYYPHTKYTSPLRSTHRNAGNGVETLGTRVFTRSQFHAGKTIKFTHKTPVIPVELQTQVFAPNARKTK